ncbi:hypothetical protein SCB71_14550 [Herbiconiux sp. KACC 21604]|uniref:hypothetical protein n=1 Tax=unclassified Herbiconiux TaxID=2618217 RepID=UPI00149229FB|nr:hypothetical protein [Herbiconiux sp. SALV-R1]QJU54363.1 hypothetical protein HL652_12490 [Herbiconiux sp. SALV-R1]WPO85433.1 hypothetical protein SCB71_14550 [Herbiconiux sp. KACC 21604]
MTAETINQAMRRFRTEADLFQQYIAQGIDEDSAAILAGWATRGRPQNAGTAAGLSDAEIDAEIARRASRVCELSGVHGCSLGAHHDGDCILLCAAHPFGLVGTQTDLVDGAEWSDITPIEARYGHLCGPCFGRARNDLHQAPQLLAHIRAQVVPSMGSARGPRVSGTREAPIPLRPDPVDDADDLYAQVVNWIVSFARHTSARPPATAIAFLKASTDAARLPSWARDQASAFTLMDDLVRWYEHHGLTIVTALPPLTVKAWCDDIAQIIGSFRSRYPQAPRKPRQGAKRECPTCGEREVSPKFYAAGTEVSCDHCGETIPAAEHDDYVDWAETTPVRSLSCDRGRHQQCASFNCACECHDQRAA